MTMPRSYYVLYFFFLLVLTGLSRFAYRGLRMIRKNIITEYSKNAIPTMVIGAGDSAYSLIKDMGSSWQVRNKVVCVMDEDTKKIGKNILGAPIIGNGQ